MGHIIYNNSNNNTQNRELKEIHIKTNKPYKVYTGYKLDVGSFIRDIHRLCNVVIVTDSNVGKLYVEGVGKSLCNAGFKNIVFSFPAGEHSKNIHTYGELLGFLAENNITRTDIILALGGGVVGDLAGFAAATYQRGMDFVQMPTSLLAAVDASVGGKTAIDLPQGKNLAGAFHQPILVLCDKDCFSTLPKEEIVQGIAEVIKHGLIGDKAMFYRTMQSNKIESFVENNIKIKADFVVGDERDKGKRQILNFGHTVGHALEILSDFKLSHGEAVALGMLWEIRSANSCGYSEIDEEALLQSLKANNLPTNYCGDTEAVVEAALRDKKRTGEAVTVVIIEEIGRAKLKTLNIDDFIEYIRAGASCV